MKELLLLINAAALVYAGAVLFIAFKKSTPAVIATLTGFLLYTVFLVSRGWITSDFLVNGLLEGVFFLPWVISFIVVVMVIFNKNKSVYLTGVVPALCFTLLASIYPKGVIPPTPNKITVWADIFFVTEACGHACFYLGGWFAALNIIRRERREGFHSLLILGFLLFSISQVSGAVWAFLGWGSPFRWGARHFQSAVIWCYYAAYLHLRFLKGWGDTKKMAYAAAGIAVVALCTWGSYFKEMTFPRIGV